MRPANARCLIVKLEPFTNRDYAFKSVQSPIALKIELSIQHSLNDYNIEYVIIDD
jgi:hypothetical protein